MNEPQCSNCSYYEMGNYCIYYECNIDPEFICDYYIDSRSKLNQKRKKDKEKLIKKKIGKRKNDI